MGQEFDDFLNGLDGEEVPPAVPTTAVPVVERTAQRLPRPLGSAAPAPQAHLDKAAQSKAKPKAAPTEAMLAADRLWRELGLLHERTLWSAALFSALSVALGALDRSGLLTAIYILLAAIAFIGAIVVFRVTRNLFVLRVALQLAIAYICALPFLFFASFLAS